MEGAGRSEEIRGGRMPTAPSLVCCFPPFPKARLRKPSGFPEKARCTKRLPTTAKMARTEVPHLELGVYPAQGVCTAMSIRSPWDVLWGGVSLPRRWAACIEDQAELTEGFEFGLTVLTAASEAPFLQILSLCVHLPQPGVILLRPAAATTPSLSPAHGKYG